MRVIFMVTDNLEKFLTAKITRYTVHCGTYMSHSVTTTTCTHCPAPFGLLHQRSMSSSETTLEQCRQMRMSPQLKRHVSTHQHSGESQCTETRHLPVQLALPSLGTSPHYHIPYTIPFVSFVCAVSHRTHRNILPAW